jgi:outer membrane protein assembly factor BamA
MAWKNAIERAKMFGQEIDNSNIKNSQIFKDISNCMDMVETKQKKFSFYVCGEEDDDGILTQLYYNEDIEKVTAFLKAEGYNAVIIRDEDDEETDNAPNSIEISW